MTIPPGVCVCPAGPRPAAPGAATMSSTVNNGAASVPSPPDAVNGFPQPGASSGAWPRAEEELRAAEPGLVTAHQASPSMGFSRQEYWSGVPLPSLELLPTSS